MGDTNDVSGFEAEECTVHMRDTHMVGIIPYPTLEVAIQPIPSILVKGLFNLITAQAGFLSLGHGFSSTHCVSIV